MTKTLTLTLTMTAVISVQAASPFHFGFDRNRHRTVYVAARLPELSESISLWDQTNAVPKAADLPVLLVPIHSGASVSHSPRGACR